MEDWQQAAQGNSPQSVRQAVLYGAVAVFLVIGFFVLRFALPTVAEGSPVKGKVVPCRRL